MTSRRMSAEALRVMPPCWVMSVTKSCAHFGSHKTTEGLQPASSARRTTRSPSAINIPVDSRLLTCAALRCAMVLSCRSRQRNAFSRSSDASSTSIITKSYFRIAMGRHPSLGRASRETHYVPLRLHRSCMQAELLLRQILVGQRGHHQSS